MISSRLLTLGPGEISLVEIFREGLGCRDPARQFDTQSAGFSRSFGLRSSPNSILRGMRGSREASVNRPRESSSGRGTATFIEMAVPLSEAPATPAMWVGTTCRSGGPSWRPPLRAASSADTTGSVAPILLGVVACKTRFAGCSM